ncbi:uncharacterized protein ankrd53 isoform 3-T3 [Spinachia spinachia]
MEPVNKCGKRRRGRCKHWTLNHVSPPDGHMFPALAAGSPEEGVDSQGLSALHLACLHGQLAAVQLLVESGRGRIACSDLQGRQPVHMVLSPRSSPNTSACLAYLLEHGADANATTYSGTTPLHLAATEGLLECTETLTRAGADVLARDSVGHTPLDAARILCHRKVARYLKSCAWQTEKRKEMQERKLVQTLYSDLVDMVKLNGLNKKRLGESVPHPVPPTTSDKLSFTTRQAAIQAAGRRSLRQAAPGLLLLQTLDHLHGPPAGKIPQRARPAGQSHGVEAPRREAASVRNRVGRRASLRPRSAVGSPREGVVPQSLPSQDRLAAVL